MIQLVHGLGPRSDLNQKWSNNAKKTGLHVWRCLTGWRSAASRINGSLHTTETFFLWQAGPYITRQRVPLTVVYDRHPTTPCPSEESWPKHPSWTAIVRLLWTGLGPQTFLPSPDSLSLSLALSTSLSSAFLPTELSQGAFGSQGRHGDRAVDGAGPSVLPP